MVWLLNFRIFTMKECVNLLSRNNYVQYFILKIMNLMSCWVMPKSSFHSRCSFNVTKGVSYTQVNI